MAAAILSVHNLQKIYLERTILDDVTFTIHEGERVALMGANGAGKSTLLSIISGKLPPEKGDVRLRRGVMVSYLDQEGGLRDDWTVEQTIDSAFAHMRDLERQLDETHLALEENPHGASADKLMRLQSELHEELERRDSHSVESRKSEATSALGVPPGDRLIGQLSGGERRRTALCRTLLEDADLLLLDEPTNHLDAETLDWLEAFLARFRGTVILITHDRYFLDNVATKMIELNRGVAKVYEGNYSDYLAAKEEEAELAQRSESTRQNLLRRELEWLRKQPRARTTKSKSRIDRAHDLIANKPAADLGSAQLLFPSGPRLGKTLVEAEVISYSIGGRKLINDFTFLLGIGDRVGVVGRNGLGKTTLLQLLMKKLEPDAGTVTLGPSVKFLYADQARRSLDPEKTVMQEVAGDMEFVQIGEQRIGFRSWLARFLFDENTAAMPIKLLSGGERNRVQLAKMLREGGNVVVLDEPTNDLDLPTLRVLEESLAVFQGCAFVVSHDRYFLNRVCTRMIGFHEGGRIDIVEGNYDDYRRFLEKKEIASRGAVETRVNGIAAAPAKASTAPKKKLNFKEQRELEGMEATIADAEKKVAELDAISQDPKTFTAKSRQEVTSLMKEQDAARAEVERLYARWEKLAGT
ncbi:energy-dependent translational throttle protein EttA [soil metagenome]